MGEDAIAAVPRKEGCLSSGCGCLAIAVLVVLAGGGVLAWLLGRWVSSQKAWDRLPADTTWAAQAHDIRTLLRASMRDPGARSLILRLEDVVERRIREAGGERDEAEGALRNFISVYDRVGVLHTIAAPNSFVVGGDDVHPEASFLIFRSPTWLRWLCVLPGSGFDGIRKEDNGDGAPVYMAARDGWMIVALREEMVRKVLDGWDAGAMPLGPGYEGDDAHVALALRERDGDKGDSASPVPQAPLEPSHFTFADPFAVPVPAMSPARDKPKGRALRLTVRPNGDGWSGEGELVGDGDIDAGRSLAGAVGDVLGAEAVAVTTPRPYDAILSARFSPEARQSALDAVSALAGERGPGSVRANLARRWLLDGWLNNTGRVWTALASGPATPRAELPYPPLPVFSLGWTMAAAKEPDDVADAFTGSLAHALDSLRAPGGPLPEQNLRASISYSLTTSGDAPGGDLGLPSVMVNAARPLWRFHPRQTPPTGWLATDPAGIPAAATASHLPAAALAEPRAGHVAFVAGWDLGDGFIDGLFAVVEDRLHSRPGAAAKWETVTRRVRDAARAFPRGSIHADCDITESRAVFRFVAPTGVERNDN